jgi:FkbM family methyltransferase
MLRNAQLILRRTSGRSRMILLLAQATVSRPLFAKVCLGLLNRFAHEGKVEFHYLIGSVHRRAFLRLAQLEADLYSAMELAIRDIYRLATLPAPKFIVDGGGNTGMFTLSAAALWPAARFKICEPVPHNLAVLKEHLEINSIQAELLPVALGGTAGRLPFYCRGATQGSISPDLPYHSIIEVPVVTLSEICQSNSERPELIKLDIEGAEVAVLHEFLEKPHEQTIIIGELHLRQKFKPEIQTLAQSTGWNTHFFEESENYSQFHFFSSDFSRRDSQCLIPHKGN